MSASGTRSRPFSAADSPTRRSCSARSPRRSAYGWGATLFLLLLGLVTINVAHGREGLLIYSPLLGLSIVALTFLASLLVASAGVLFSLRASTVRQAAQSLMVASMVLLLVPILGFQVLPDEAKLSLVQTLTDGATPTSLILGVLPVLAVLDTVLLLIARARFQRGRLVLADPEGKWTGE